MANGASWETAVFIQFACRAICGRMIYKTLRAMTVLAHGPVLLPDILVAADLREGRLTRVLTQFTVTPAPVNAIFPPGRLMSRKVRNFIDFSAGHFRAMRARAAIGAEPQMEIAAATVPQITLGAAA